MKKKQRRQRPPQVHKTRTKTPKQMRRAREKYERQHVELIMKLKKQRLVEKAERLLATPDPSTVFIGSLGDCVLQEAFYKELEGAYGVQPPWMRSGRHG